MPHHTPLLSVADIDTRTRQLGAQIREHYADAEVVMLVVLKGATLFAADLLRAMGGPTALEFIQASSYQGTESTGSVSLSDLPADLAGRHVLLVEDIVDTGHTLLKLLDTLGASGAASVRTVSLLDKPSRRQVEVTADWVGFSIEDVFVIGYGLDLDGRYRDLPHVAVYHP